MTVKQPQFQGLYWAGFQIGRLKHVIGTTVANVIWQHYRFWYIFLLNRFLAEAYEEIQVDEKDPQSLNKFHYSD